jgi:hypothetical protein
VARRPCIEGSLASIDELSPVRRGPAGGRIVSQQIGLPPKGSTVLEA